jgi:hypothetical protein
MFNKLKKNYHPYFTPIWLVQIWSIIEMILAYVNYESEVLSVLRYFLFFIATIWLIKSLLQQNYNINLASKIYLLWIIGMLIGSIPYLISDYENYLYLKQFLSGIFFMYVSFFLIAAKLDLDFFKRLFKFSFTLILIYLLISIPFFYVFTQNLSYGAEGYTFFASAGSILVLTLPYHSINKRKLIVLAFIIAIILMMILARRNKVIYFASILFFSYFINIVFKNSFYINTKNKIFKSMILLVLLFSVVLTMFSNKFELFFSRMKTGMESREDIIDLFRNDFDSTPEDWIWGRGIFGKFEGGMLATFEDSGLRDGIENGYYQIILNGGWVLLSIFILICINAIYKGFFKSNNLLIKSFASILIVLFISMFAMNQQGIGIKSIIIYISIAACNSKFLRNLSDQYLKENIGLK